MSRSFNKVTLLGRLTRDPELRQTPGGQSVCSFGLALNRSYKDASGEWKEQADFIDVQVWGNQAERVADRVSQGSNVLVEGALRSRSWTADDGSNRSKVDVNAYDVIFMDKPSDNEDSHEESQ